MSPSTSCPTALRVLRRRQAVPARRPGPLLRRAGRLGGGRDASRQARDAAARVEVRYAAGASPVSRVKAEAAHAYAPKTVRGFIETDSVDRRLRRGLRRRAGEDRRTYETPFQHHHAIEPHASMAVWDGDAVTVYVSAQLPIDCRDVIAATLQIPEGEGAHPLQVRGRRLRRQAGDRSRRRARRRSPRASSGRPVKTAFTRQQTCRECRAPHRIDPARAAGRRTRRAPRRAGA